MNHEYWRTRRREYADTEHEYEVSGGALSEKVGYAAKFILEHGKKQRKFLESYWDRFVIYGDIHTEDCRVALVHVEPYND